MALATIALVFAAGCHAHERRYVGLSVQGRLIECERFGLGGDVVLIIATIHGDEAAGTPLVRCLADHLTNHPDLLAGRRILIVPVANPDGHARHTRGNIRGVDLNRNFPADNFAGSDRHGAAPLSEPESRALKALLDQHRPDRIVSIHQPLACIDYDGPAEGLARAMAATTDLTVDRLGSRPGSLGSYAGLTLGVPIITLELPASADCLDDDTLWHAYGPTLLAAIRYPDAVGPAGAR